MRQIGEYTIDIPIEFAFDWLLHGNYFLSSLDLKSFQYDKLETGGKFIAYEEINEHRFLPLKGEYLKLERPRYFQIRIWFPGGIQTIGYQLEGIERITQVKVTLEQKYYSFFQSCWSWLTRKKKSEAFQPIFELEKQNLEEAFGYNRLNTKISGILISEEEMQGKWSAHHPSNPYLSWVRSNV